MCLIHETSGNNQVHHTDTQIVQRLHLRYQRERASTELGLADEHRSDWAGFALPAAGRSSSGGRGLRAFQVRQCRELSGQLLRFFIGISRDDVAAKDNLVLSRLPPMSGGLCFVVRNNLGNIRRGGEGQS